MRTRLHPAIVAVLLGIAATGCDRGSRPGQVGQPAPLFRVADGTATVDLAQWRGHVVLVHFWAAWCPPCVHEMPSLITLQHTLPQVQVLAVSTDDDPDLYARFLARQHVDLLSVRDGDHKANALYGTYRFPETFVVDKAGIVRRKFIGDQDWSSPEVQDYLRKLAAA